ncbi:hypothetical protein COT48_04615 [Candidatus Woesearchaeota archaeon CG08_land_8_20_14_0_20_47_9]|nr:MAG: hypothetical protein COV22_03680 [Candidatus Woesearchaeota archaeon CG10_big_fil_rev_8_21_14_0_10_47_5]PIO03483.1 MAG: hypothetical protein COT48_04615 [Candidatus Woesearchaeota archaeon CG08_land_8_20_14_0_20_47_9]HII29940.1 hypothetical protein [Candidatus Woesearchaeota archaeon]
MLLMQLYVIDAIGSGTNNEGKSFQTLTLEPRGLVASLKKMMGLGSLEAWVVEGSERNYKVGQTLSEIPKGAIPAEEYAKRLKPL